MVLNIIGINDKETVLRTMKKGSYTCPKMRNTMPTNVGNALEHWPEQYFIPEKKSLVH